MSRSKKKEEEIYKLVDEYFESVTNDDLRPPQWKVSIGGGYYDAKEAKAAIRCYLLGLLSTQKTVVEFEDAFASYMGLSHCAATNSGTSANVLALNTLIESGHLQPGDEVAIPATTFISVATPIIQLGLVPVYIDVNVDTLNMDPTELEKVLQGNHKVKCVIIVHTLGYPAEMDRFVDIAKEHKLKIVEDCCEAHGASFKGKKVGSFGDIATWSFYVAHNMTTAEGGMVGTSSEEYATIIRDLREFGRDRTYTGERYGYTKGNLVDFDERYTFHLIGWNFRMADAPAAFGNEQLKKLDQTNAIRQKNAEYLIRGLAGLGSAFILPPLSNDVYTHVYYSFPLTIKEGSGLSRKGLTQYLESEGVETRAIMCGTLPDQPSLSKAPGRSGGALTNSRYVRDNSFFVGCHPLLDTVDLDYLIEKMTNYVKNIK